MGGVRLPGRPRDGRPEDDVPSGRRHRGPGWRDLLRRLVRPGVGGHGTRDNRYSGTIYRVAPKGFKSVVPKIDLGVPEGQLLALRSPASNVRGAGFARLKAQGDKVADDVASLLGDANPYVAARAVWLLAQLGDKGVALARKELASADATRRLVAFRALRAAGRDVFALCQSAATDASPRSVAKSRSRSVTSRPRPPSPPW